MPIVELIMPRMGESVVEATVINWLKKEGDLVEEDETVLEVATDKVDSEVPSPYAGVIKKILRKANDVVPVGHALALIETEASVEPEIPEPTGPIAKAPDTEKSNVEKIPDVPIEPAAKEAPEPVRVEEPVHPITTSSAPDRYYSPLVRNIARTENISKEELQRIPGTGGQGRVTKDDMMAYLQKRNEVYTEADPPVRKQKFSGHSEAGPSDPGTARTGRVEPLSTMADKPRVDGDADIIEMDRMRRLIADHMIQSLQTSAHVTSFVEADVTNMVRWRSDYKDEFASKYNTRLTYTPLFIECINKAIHDYPRINSSVVGNQIHLKRAIHMGIATALDNGNLIVPVIKESDDLSLIGLAKKVNDLAERARTGNLKPEEISGGTFTISNIGTFGNTMGTPIINQPQVAVLALGAIKKKPVVLETQGSDTIAIRHMMFLSLSYDHRIIDGFYGGSFLNRIAEYIESFDPNRKI